MKKLYHIHLTAPMYRNKGITKGFEANGWQVKEVDWMGLKMRVGPHRMWDQIIGEIQEYQPSLVFAQIQTSGVLYNPGIIEKIQRTAPMVMFTVDARTPEQSAWMYNLNKTVSHFFYSNSNDVHECYKRGITNCSVLQSACDTDEYFYEPSGRKTPEVVFIGNRTSNFPNSMERMELVHALYNKFGSRFGAYGLGFGEGFVNVARERELYSNCKVAILHNNFNYPYYDSDRKWRALACGALTVGTNHFTTEETIAGIEDVVDLPKTVFSTNTTVSYSSRVPEIEKMLYFRKQYPDVSLKNLLM